MTKVIIFQDADGHILSCFPCAVRLEGETDEAYLDRVMTATKKPEWTYLGVVEGAALPSGKYRLAWKWDNGSVVEDPVKVKSMKWDDAKKKRDGLLDGATVKKMNADDDGDQKAVNDWKQYRKQLRDIEKDYADPDAIVWPTPPS